MSAFLIDTLLSQSGDVCDLIEKLCWETQGNSVPEKENVEVLTHVIRRIRCDLAEKSTQAGLVCKTTLQTKLEDVVNSRCLPTLKKLSADKSSAARDSSSLRRSICELIAGCAEICSRQLTEALLSASVSSLLLCAEDQSVESSPNPSAGFDFDSAVDILASTIPLLSAQQDSYVRDIKRATIACIKTCGEADFSRVVVKILFPLLNNGELYRSEVLGQLWSGLETWQAIDDCSLVISRLLLILTALSDYLLPSCSELRSLSVDLRMSERFWEVIQAGVMHPDCVSRKRALYLLKKSVALSAEWKSTCQVVQAESKGINLFWWSLEKNKVLLQFWEDYILILETLDENQIHVVKPVLQKIDQVVDAINAENKDGLNLHISWLICIYARMFDSENKAVMKEGVSHLLNLDAVRNPQFSHGLADFIVGPFLVVLSETTLFQRSSEQMIGCCPEIGVKLNKFFVRLFSSLPEDRKGEYLLKIVHNLSSRNWCAVPILFILQALAQVKDCRVHGVEGLHAFREVLRGTMITHQVLIRGAAQCYLLQTALNLTDETLISLDDVANFIMHFRTEESLLRGTLLWNQLCDWLAVHGAQLKPVECIESGNSQMPALSLYAKYAVEMYMRVPLGDGNQIFLPDLFEAERIAKMVILAVDVEEKWKLESYGEKPLEKTLDHLLQPLIECLQRLGTSLYLPIQKSDKSLQLLLKLLSVSHTRNLFQQKDDVLQILHERLLFSSEEIFHFLLRRLSGELCLLSDLPRCTLYISTARALVNLCMTSHGHRKSHALSFFVALTKISVQNLLASDHKQESQLSAQIQKMVSMSSLSLVCELLHQNLDLQTDLNDSVNEIATYISSMELNTTLLKPTDCDENQSSAESRRFQGWGRAAARYIHDQWACLHFVLDAYCKTSEPKETVGPFMSVLDRPSATMLLAIDALSILPSDQVLPVLACMKVLAPKILATDALLCTKSMNLAWKVIQDLNSNPHDFWPALEAFIQFVFDVHLLCIPFKNENIICNKIKQIAFQLTDMSQTKTGVFNVLIKHCSQIWMALPSESVQNPFGSALNHIQIFVEACIFGPVFRRDQRLMQDVNSYVEQLGEDCAANVAITRENRNDQLPRVYAVIFLCKLNQRDELHKMFIEDLVLHLLNKDEIVSNSKKRYYGNSLQHRIKNRLWQILLLVLPKLDEVFLTQILDKVYKAGFRNNQPSVKYLIEWFIILTLHYYPKHLHSFWDCFSYDQVKSKTSICTFLSVLSHCDVVLLKSSDKSKHLKKALDVILLWCFNHNFAVRLYALLALKRVWNLCKISCSEEEGFSFLAPLIESCLQQVEYMQGSGNAMKNWQKIQEHFFFGIFHPIKDYSIETIFYTFPRLSDLADDEWIPMWKFENADFPVDTHISLNNPQDNFTNLVAGDWIQQDKVETDTDSQWTDLQKKMVPWKNSIPEQDLEMIYHERAAKLGKSSSALIVVASLIDKPTNLGGLCRTCEIFAASSLVLSGMHYVTDKQFQALSVSAEHWLPLLEVKPPQLINYLLQKKAEGYTVVGVEQTVNSQSLSDYTFPEKTLLLLGNEREGIPANLLQHLDTCIEVPQLGVTRSLNVHVTGALLIWQYTHQQILKQKQKHL
ncbi:LOW QUALITY PROTEIN: probable methyltransferase TARBP1 [Erpetoichthys calabaricus]|uniref:LOW QUALITY PROTEIN: probable methyltransferase TARBP1 n=1 Tax=Erpetoichthys calabaricus TaxID=27687 RepID=UPI002234DA69|nr:LOW QUALITY PROTEIN: probable methyltransferase TARBP1 [Erpetoichthys calabaricus]